MARRGHKCLKMLMMAALKNIRDLVVWSRMGVRGGAVASVDTGSSPIPPMRLARRHVSRFRIARLDSDDQKFCRNVRSRVQDKRAASSQMGSC